MATWLAQIAPARMLDMEEEMLKNAPATQGGRLLVFDVNQTLLDINALKPHFERLFNDGTVLQQWFAHMLLYSQTVTQTGDYVDFGRLAAAALQMMGEIHGAPVQQEDIQQVAHAMRALPAYAEVLQALQRLREHGYRTVALTNSGEAAAREQLEAAGLTGMFERVFSVDAVKKYKPAGDVYRYVAQQLGVNTSDMTMIAAHPWDLMGAKAAGCAVAFLQRPGTAWIPLTSRPAMVAEDLGQLADQFLAAANDR